MQKLKSELKKQRFVVVNEHYQILCFVQNNKENCWSF